MWQPYYCMPNAYHISPTLTCPTPNHTLSVHGNTIMQDLPGSLCHAATTPDYRVYLQTKYNLANTAIKDINWLMVKLTIR